MLCSKNLSGFIWHANWGFWPRKLIEAKPFSVPWIVAAGPNLSFYRTAQLANHCDTVIRRYIQYVYQVWWSKLVCISFTRWNVLLVNLTFDLTLKGVILFLCVANLTVLTWSVQSDSCLQALRTDWWPYHHTSNFWHKNLCTNKCHSQRMCQILKPYLLLSPSCGHI